MSKKWIGITIYFIFLVILTYIFALYSEAEKVAVFLNNQKDELKEDNLKLLSATVIANYHDNTQTYIKEEPLYSQSFISHNNNNEINYSVDVYIYTFVEFKGDNAHNSIAIILKNLLIKDDNATLTDDINDLNAQITFSQNVQIGSTTKKSSTETFTTVFDNDMRLIMFNFDQLITSPLSTLALESILITYPTEAAINKSLVALYNSNYTNKASDVFNEDYNRDILNVEYPNINILNQYGTNDFNNQSGIYYNEQMLKTFNSVNPIFKYFGYELLLIIPLTYFIFFHKHVRIIIKRKKLEANKQKEARYNQIKEELYQDKETIGKKD